MSPNPESFGRLAIAPGTTLDLYQVTAKIGEGSMGEVYRARNTKLDRDVALKVLPDLFADDTERCHRPRAWSPPAHRPDLYRRVRPGGRPGGPDSGDRLL